MTEILEDQQVRQYKIDRPALIAALQERDGDECFYCHRDFTVRERTIDHFYPQSVAYEEGWTYERVWDRDNLRLACKACNSKKGNLVPNPDGTIPERKRSTFRYRRDKRAQRAEICTACNVGRNLGPDEVCAACGSGPLPERYPRWAKMPATDCDHEAFWCAWCSIGVIPRKGATEMLMMGNEAQEEGLLD